MKEVFSLNINPVIVPTVRTLKSYNFYIVEHDGHHFLIDAGLNNDDCWSSFVYVLTKNNLAIEQIEGIVLTHSHHDHIGLVNRLHEQCSIPVYAHPNATLRMARDKQYLESRAKYLTRTYELMGAKKEAKREVIRLMNAIHEKKAQQVIVPVQPLVEGDTIFGLRVIEIFGHTQDHLAFYDEKAGMLFAGDHVLKRMATNALIDFTEDGKLLPTLVQYEKSLRKIKQLSLSTIYPGHGDLIENPYVEIDNQLERIERQANRLLEYLLDKKSPAQLAKMVYGAKYEKQFPLVMSHIIGHLNRLERQERVQKELVGETFYYWKC